MFLIVLGGSLALGTSLFVASSYSEGTWISPRTVAEIIGWLFVLATLVGVLALRQPNLGKLTAAIVTFCSGLLMLYVSHFEWTDIAAMPTAYAAAETLHSDLKVIEAPSPALAAALGMKEVAIPDMPKGAPTKPIFALASSPALRANDACAALTGIESLQCRRCSQKSGLAFILCQESARLEYCEARHGDEACPSPFPQSYPG